MSVEKFKYCPVRDCMMGADGMPMLNQAERAGEPCMPYVFGDIADHTWNGIQINGRAGQRELRKSHGMVPFEPISKHARKMPKRDFNQQDDHWQDWLKLTREDVAEGAGTTAEKVLTEQAARKAEGSLRERVKLKAAGKQDESPRTTIHGPVNNPTIKTVAAYEERKPEIKSEVREFVARRAADRSKSSMR